MSLTWLGKGEGIAAIGFALSVVATGLLIAHYISSAEWVSFVQWVWASFVGGAAAAAYRDRWKPLNGNGGGS